MGIEIERKFLVNTTLWQQVDKPAGKYIKQGYIVNKAGRTVRLRITDDNAWLTFKGETTGISRSEYEYMIPVNDAVEMFEQFVDAHIEKIRYYINHAGKLWEVDEFLGDNAGLLVAEIELKYEDEQFELPPWVAIEVSSDERYYNASLAVYPFKKWL